MKISALETRRYEFPYATPFHAAWDPVPRRGLTETIVAVHTDTGVSGYAGGAPVPDRELLEHLLVGRDPNDTDAVFGICETVDLHGGRNWTVEVAVWDLLARVADVPLWELLDGSRSSFPAYASCGQRLPPAARADRVAGWWGQGVRAAKLRIWHDDWREGLADVAATRHAVGDEMEIMVDVNQAWRMPGDLTPRWGLPTALECAAALDAYDVYWLEEPLDTAAVEEYARLRDASPVRIAAGEFSRTLAESRRLVAAVDVIQNDVVLSGGITGCRRVAAWAEEAGIVWSPHTWGTGLGLLANLHAALAFSTGDYLEVPFDPPDVTAERRDFMLPEPVELAADGTIAPPPGPGLGMVPDFDALERWRVG